MKSEEEPVKIFSDGGCHGNPGVGGWGVVLRWKKHKKKLFGGAKHTTNNKMELTAAIMGLRALKKECKVHLTTDSQYVKDGITKWIKSWKRNGWLTSTKEPVKNMDLWKMLDELTQLHDVNWHWVRGHSGHQGNEQADALATRGIEKILKEFPELARKQKKGRKR